MGREVRPRDGVREAGLEIIPKRKAHFGPVDPVKSREIFIHSALVEGEYDTGAKSLLHNRELERTIAHLEDKARRRDLMVEAEARYAFYDQRLPSTVFSGRSFEKWRKDAERSDARVLYMSIDDVLIGDSTEVGEGSYPDRFVTAGGDLDLRYRYDPSAPDDGVTLEVPVEQLGQIDADRADRLVPGLLAEKIEALMRTLPKQTRRYFDIPAVAKQAGIDLMHTDGSLIAALAENLSNRAGVTIRPDTFNTAQLPDHLAMRYRVVNPEGEEIATSRDLVSLRREFAEQIKAGFTGLAKGEWHRDGITAWDFGELPKSIEIATDPAPILGYPGIVDEGPPGKNKPGHAVGLRVFDTPEVAKDATRLGLARLGIRRLKADLRFDDKAITNFQTIALWYAPLGSPEQLRDEIMMLIADRLFVGDAKHPRTYEEFSARIDNAWNRLSAVSTECTQIAEQVFTRFSSVASRLEARHPQNWDRAIRDMRAQLGSLVTANTLTRTPFRWLRGVPRFLRAMEVRMERLRGGGVDRDLRAMADVHKWQRLLAERAAKHQGEGIVDPNLVEFRWMHEEFRVSVFAQELKTSVPVSDQRMEKAWEKVRP